MFATLDATTRKLPLPGGETVFLTDTVGFVRKLPHQLVTAFKTTLDVVRDADLLVHVVDGSGPDPEGSMSAVRQVIEDLDADRIPELILFNKSDCGDGAARMTDRYEGSVAVSAHSGHNLSVVLETIGDRVRSTTELAELVVPWERGDVLASIYREGQVLSEVAGETGMRVTARLEAASLGALRDFVINEEDEEVIK